MRSRRTLLAALLLATTGSLVACGDGEPAASPSTTEAPAAAADGPDLSAEEFEDLTGETEVRITVRDNTYDAKYFEVTAGTTITYENRGRVEHNLLPVTPGAFASIEAEDLQAGDAQTLTFDEPGEYAYYCSLHGTKTKGMVGAVRVLA
jgi:plastocyanin